MRIWATGSEGHRGFSLLELLLTLVIVGLIVSLAGLSINSGGRSYEIDAAVKQFVGLARYALDEAQLSGVDAGLLLSLRKEQGADIYSYEWLQRGLSGWQSSAWFEQDVYGPRDIPFGVQVLLEVEQDDTLLRDELTDELSGELDDDENEEDVLRLQPQVIFYASGETTPGLMSWRQADSGALLWEVEWDLLGRLSTRRRGEDE